MWTALTLLFVSITVSGGLLLAAQETAPFQARLLVCASGLAAAYCLRQALRRKPPGVSFGSAAFAKPEELTDLLLDRDENAAPGSVFLGLVGEKRLYLPPHRARQHGVIVGGSGTGKSFGFFLPNAAMIRQTSAVFSDPKSELWRYTSGFHPSLRYAPCEPEASECFNWVPLCREARIAEITARALIEAGNTRHTEQACLDVESAFLAALFSHASVLPVPTPLTAYHLFTRQEPKVVLDQMNQSLSPVAREQSVIFRQTSERTRLHRSSGGGASPVPARPGHRPLHLGDFDTA